MLRKLTIFPCILNARKQKITIGNKFSESVAKFRYLGTSLIDQNCIYGEFKRRLNSGNACHSSVQDHLLLHLLSKSIKIKIENYNCACIISDFHSETAKNCALLGYYAPSSGKKLPILAA